MRVIIQDMETKAFLAADGRWVKNKADARDFQTLLRAYHFARANTARNFEVLLHCPEDDYSAAIINGVGTANGVGATNTEAAVESPAVEAEVAWSSRNFASKKLDRFHFEITDTSRIQWN